MVAPLKGPALPHDDDNTSNVSDPEMKEQFEELLRSDSEGEGEHEEEENKENKQRPSSHGVKGCRPLDGKALNLKSSAFYPSKSPGFHAPEMVYPPYPGGASGPGS